MGVPMAAHVARAGHDLTVWNRSPGKAAALGLEQAPSIKAAVTGADVVVLMLFGPDAVREVLVEVVRHAPDALVIDSSSIGPSAAHEFAAIVPRYVDAPVAGSVKPATDGTLGVFVGGSAEDVAAAMPLLELWGDPERIVHVGGVGSASALKLCVNQGLGVMAAGLGESLRLGRDLGLERELLLKVLSQTAYGWYLGQKSPMIESGDYTGTTFSLDLMEKDLHLAIAASDSELRVTTACHDLAHRALDAGHSGEDYAALTGYLADEGEANSH
jgi:3-hydroxyisobutyrate dehydrogenase